MFLMERLHEIFPGAECWSDSNHTRAPAAQGSYLLVIDLDEPISATLARRAIVILGGRYFYAGSARGSGGIRGRLSHHFRRDKKTHWHVDQLTLAAGQLHALSFPGLTECELVDRLVGAAATIPHPGFGSSDCKSCKSHLLQLPT